MKNTMLLLTLLFSVNAFAADSGCRHEKNLRIISMMKMGFSYGEASDRAQEGFKVCVCGTGNETENAIEEIEESVEIELMLPDPVRIVNVPVKHARDFWVAGRNTDTGQCLASIDGNELCNTPLKAALEQYFQIHASCGKDPYISKADLEMRRKYGIAGPYERQ